MRAFLARFRGEGLEVALEATTGWRFVVEELQRIGAEVHLAEAAEAAALKGKKKRAKTDWADARHQRELLLIGRLPESWIPPVHILDLRARVRTRHLLSHQRTEWQQRIHSVLYHHGVPQQRNLLTLEKPNFPDPRTTMPSNPARYGSVAKMNGVIWAVPKSIAPQSPAVKQAATACGPTAAAVIGPCRLPGPAIASAGRRARDPGAAVVDDRLGRGNSLTVLMSGQSPTPRTD